MTFSTHRRLEKRIGKYGTSRETYIRRLIEEFGITKSENCKAQVLANLANFAYDPINYDHLRNFGAIDLFLSQLQSDNLQLKQFAISGICNLAPEPINKQALLNRDAIPLVASCLQSEVKQIILSVLAIFFYLSDNSTNSLIATPENVHSFRTLTMSDNTEISNMAMTLLETLNVPL